jgi:hypothetical protein
VQDYGRADPGPTAGRDVRVDVVSVEAECAQLVAVGDAGELLRPGSRGADRRYRPHGAIMLGTPSETARSPPGCRWAAA